ncbi:MAG TPA: MBOAT family O-acyltransferase [Saprospiraceae bacterium]|nr:MBOAT family O-acyltransferase [Saprospiraceae bacterium]
MLFNSFEFLVFFPIVTILFFLLPHRFRWSLLLTASCIFYMYFIPVYIVILFGTIVIDYFAGIYLEDTPYPAKKKYYLMWSLAANIGVLAVFKYYNFFLDNINETALAIFDKPTALRYLGIALPIGLSFHTFQAMSYTFEVYYGRQKAERHFGIYALYVMFYPQLVAGPIERPQNILHQFHEKKFFNYDRFSSGLGLMVWGMFKKVVIADNLAGLVNMAYTHPEDKSGWVLLIASYFFAIQIYCDFSGYSDIAIGAARVMGYDLMENFRNPYVSGSIREFWSRWHISLSTWFRDYLYIPLGGNRVGKSRWMFNLFIVFLVSGIWHGANWTYVIWGALHGIYLMIAIVKDDYFQRNNLTEKFNQLRLRKIWDVLITFHLVTFAWIFFRAESVQDAFVVIRKIFTLDFNPALIKASINFFALDPKHFGRIIFLIAIILGFMIADPMIDPIAKRKKELRQPVWRFGLYATLVACIILLGFFGEVSFIYFQF